MENLEKVLIGLALFAVTSIVAYLFKMRQLYVTTPKLFRHSRISKDGSLCEVIVYNRGNQAEEDIKVEIDPALKGELLASSSDDISLEGATLKFERLHKRREASAILLIENGVLEASRIVALSSKGVQGKIVRNVSEVPPNAAFAFLFMLMILLIFPGMIYGTRFYSALREQYVEYRLEASYEQGWRNLASYYGSQLRLSYGDNEFPLRLSEDRVQPKDILTFEAYNKTAVPLEITSMKKDRAPGDISSFVNETIPPMSKQRFLAKLPPNDSASRRSDIVFSFKSGGEFLYNIEYSAAK